MQQQYPPICEMSNLNIKYQMNEVAHTYQSMHKFEMKIIFVLKNFLIIVNVLLNVLPKNKTIKLQNTMNIGWKKLQTQSSGPFIVAWVDDSSHICCHGNQSIFLELFKISRKYLSYNLPLVSRIS